LIEKSDLDKTKALEILSQGTPGSPLIKTVLPRMVARDYTPNFLLPLMAKDLAYSLAEAERHGSRLAMVASAFEMFKRAATTGGGEQDFSAVIEPLRDDKTKKNS